MLRALRGRAYFRELREILESSLKISVKKRKIVCFHWHDRQTEIVTP